MKTVFRSVVPLVLAVSVAILMAACGSSSSKSSSTSSAASGSAPTSTAASGGSSGLKPTGSHTIGLLPANLSSEITLRETDNAKATAAALGWKTIVSNPNNVPTTAEADMMNFVNQGVSAIFVIATDATTIEQGLQAAKAKGIPVFSLLVAPEPSTRQLFTANIADPSETIGKLAAEAVVKRYPDTPILQDQLTCNYAGSGFATPFAAEVTALGKKVADTYNMSCANLVGDATTAAKTMLPKYTGPVVYVTLLDFAPPLLESVFEQLHRTNVTVVARYDIAPTLALIRAGKPVLDLATNVNVGMFEAYDRLLAHWVAGKPLDTTNDLTVHGFKIVDKTNVPKTGDVYPFDPALAAQVAAWRKQYELPKS
jgi:ABC-type sugar transport system substrate-binding protein